jgi:hypothetical protein
LNHEIVESTVAIENSGKFVKPRIDTLHALNSYG